jgi:TatD DNase family protein
VLVDSHSHLDAPEFDPDREQVIARARAAGVTRQVLCATEAAGWPTLRTIRASAPGLYAAYGLHPMFVESHRDEHLNQLRDWLEREQPVAVGECGLDYFVDGLDPRDQLYFFEAQLRLAREFDLPVIVHARRAVDAVITAIRRIGGLRGVVHSFSGSPQQAEQLWRERFLLGLGGPVTYERARRLRKLAATMPLEWLLLETDAPDQPDAAIRGQRNEPARLVQVLDTIAQLRGVQASEVASATSTNAERLFRFGTQS